MRRLLFIAFLIIAACSPSPSDNTEIVTGPTIPNDPTGPGDTDDTDDRPAAPANLTAVAGDGNVTLTWNAVSNAGAYHVSRSAMPGGPYIQLDTVQATTYTDSAVTNGQTYYYAVQSDQDGTRSVYSAEASAQPVAGNPGPTPPAAPTDLALWVLSGTSIRATWTDNASNETGSTLERATIAGAFTGVTSLAAGVTTYTSSGLVSGTTYRFRVRTFSTQLASAYTPEVSTATPGGSPGDMVTVTAGCFAMGDTFSEGILQDGPSHTVCLNSDFEIDTHEVTNAAYRACVTAGSCTAPGNVTSKERLSYYDAADFDAYPVVYVTWAQATAYCTWAGKRLPTEAEWEKAARGGLAGMRFPWGDTITCDNANYYTTNSFDYDIDPSINSQTCSAPGTTDGDTTLAGAYAPNGLGVYDMSGNVMEWVQDWWSFHAADTVTDPTGPASGSERVLRGGDYSHDAEWAKVTFRTFLDPTESWHDTGFRCAQ